MAMRCGSVVVAGAVVVAGLAAGSPAIADEAKTAPDKRTALQQEADCWVQFMESDSKEISCSFPALMETEDRESIAKLTRQVFKDASCQITIKLERALIDNAVTTPDLSFVAPAQPVSCEVKTSKGDLPVAFTFAPKIQIKGGKAIKASPGMGNVTGVNSWLAWPVVAYVNGAGSIQDVMLRVVNAYLERKRERQ
jgi:hypothetical protein